MRGSGALPLSILKGVEPFEIREPRFDSKGTQISSRRRIYRLKMPIADVLAVARKELPKPEWYHSKTGVVGSWWFIDENKSPFLMSNMHITIRANKIDPDSMAVLGPLSDSKVWTTVSVTEARPHPNVAIALWHWLRNKVSPPKTVIIKSSSGP